MIFLSFLLRDTLTLAEIESYKKNHNGQFPEELRAFTIDDPVSINKSIVSTPKIKEHNSNIKMNNFNTLPIFE